MQKKTLTERVFHAVCFEVIALITTAPLFAWLMDRSIFQMGMLAILLSTTAMIWNIIYNAIFDHFWPATRIKRNAKVRVYHTLGFEGGFIFIGVTLIMGLLGISMKAAFMMEIGFFLFFLPYTYLFNLAYDSLRASIFKRRAKKVSIKLARNHNK